MSSYVISSHNAAENDDVVLVKSSVKVDEAFGAGTTDALRLLGRMMRARAGIEVPVVWWHAGLTSPFFVMALDGVDLTADVRNTKVSIVTRDAAAKKRYAETIRAWNDFLPLWAATVV